MFIDINKVKLCNCHTKPKFKYGIQVPHNYDDVLRIDNANGNTLWQDVLKKEMDYILEYKVFKDIGLNAAKPDGFKNIRVHFVYDVKHDG